MQPSFGIRYRYETHDDHDLRNLDPALKERLRVRAAQRGHSMEAEARNILKTALDSTVGDGRNLYERIGARLDPLGGVELDLPARDPTRPAPRFE